MRTATIAAAVIAHSGHAVTLLYSMSMSMSSFFQNNLLLRKACNASVPFGDCTEGEANAQHVVSVIYSWKAFIQYIIPVVLLVLAGPWSDSHGGRRRPLIMWPVVGQILTDGLCAVNVYFWSWPPQVAAVFEAVTPGLFGARNVFWVGMVSHISDNSVTSSRTLKYGIMNAMYIIGSLIGTGVAGLVNVRLGFYGAFAVSVLLNVTALSIAWMFLQDVQCKPCDDGRTAWFNPKRLARGYLDVFRSGGTAAYAFTLLTLLVCQGTLVSRLGGEYAIMYLFMRYKFNWYEVKYSYYAAYKMITILFGTLFAVVVMSHRLKIHDAIIGCVACVFDMVAAIGYIFVEQPWQLYIVPAIDIFHGTALTITTSLTSKLVKSDELGRINSIQGLFSTLLMFVIVPLYTATYNFTFEHLAGAVFTLNIIFTIPVLATFSIVYLKYKYLWTRETVQCNSEAQGSA